MSARPTKPAILFVDDEADLLAGIRLALRKERAEWDLEFAVGGPAALEHLARRAYDVVVSDMRMPGMDGATLLGRVRQQRPETVRIVLSGEADEKMALRALPVAHRWLTKPCEREHLVATLRQAVASRSYVEREDLRAVLGELSSVPSIPRLHDELLRRIAHPEFGLEQIAEVIGRDPGMAAKILQMANSALFGRERRLVAIGDAVALLGLRTLSHMTLAAEVFSAVRRHADEDAAACDAIERRALMLSRVAHALFPDDSTAAELAATAGLLHEVGSLLLLRYRPDAYRQARELAEREALDPAVAEQQVCGVHHGEVAAALLCAWGLSMDLVDVLANHHEPQRWQERVDVCAALHFAEAVVATPWIMGEVASLEPEVDWPARAREALLAW